MLSQPNTKSVILVDSTHRDRGIDPLCSEFTTFVSRDGTNNSINCSDRVGIGYPLHGDLTCTYVENDSQLGTYIDMALPTFIDNIVNITPYYDKYVEAFHATTLVSKGAVKCKGAYEDSGVLTVFLESNFDSNVDDSTDAFYIRQLAPTPKFRFLAQTTAINLRAITIVGGSSVDDFYRGMYLTNLMDSLYDTYIIETYNGTTKVATINTGFVSSVVANDICEIYSVKSNFEGLSTSGSSLTKGVVNHVVNLDWVRIPKFKMFTDSTVDDGDDYTSYNPLVNSYPHLLVEFRNTAQGVNNIQSNDNQSRVAQFICTAEDTNVTSGSFLTLKGTKPCIIPFSQTEPIRFSIKLPNGCPLDFPKRYDYRGTLAYEPSIETQVSAQFSLERIIADRY